MKTEGNMILIFVSIELKLEILLVQDITHRKTEEESSLWLKEGHDSARSGKLYAGESLRLSLLSMNLWWLRAAYVFITSQLGDERMFLLSYMVSLVTSEQY